MSRYLNNPDKNWYKRRVNGTLLVVLAAFALLVVRLFYLQVVEGEEFRRLSKNNCIRLQQIDAFRGLIFDRQGVLLVDNRPSFDLSIVLKDARPLDKTLEKLAEYLDESVEALTLRIDRVRKRTSSNRVLLKRDIGRDTLAVLEAHKFDLPGVNVNVRPLRNYVHKHSAAHLLGYLSEVNASELKSGKYPNIKSGDCIGKFGAEKMYESYLRGIRGGRQVEVNAAGKVVRVLQTVDAQPGNNVYLTIDQELQQRAEALLTGLAGAVVAMEPATGDVLVIASSPSFDQNAFVSGLSHKEWNALTSNPERPMEDKAIQAEYPPASTYKIITSIAGLEEGVIDENSSFYCPGYHKFGDRIYRCWKRAGHGHVSVVKALSESCDVFFYQVGQKLGVDRLARYAKACGLGCPTGIDLGNEAAGLIPTAAWKKRRFGVSWQGGETLSIAIGQGYNLVTPLQMLSLIAAVGNDGIRCRPTILKKIETADGEMVLENRPEILGKLPVSQKNLDIVRKGLRAVVNTRHGTAWRVRIKGVEMCGKTGTAQVFSYKKNAVRGEVGPRHLKPHAWFVAYAPAEKPKIAVSVIVEHGEHGSSAAAPIASEVVRAWLEKVGNG